MARSSWTGPVAPTKPSGRSSRRMSFRRSAKQSAQTKSLAKLSYLQLWRRKNFGAADLSRKQTSGDLCGQRCCKVRADQRRQSVTDIWSAASRAPEKGHADRLLLVVQQGLPVRAAWQVGPPGWSSTASRALRRPGSVSLTLRFLGTSSSRDGRRWECKESSRQAQLSGSFTFAQRDANAAKGGAHRSSARTALTSTCWTRQLSTKPLACQLYRSTCAVRYRYSQAGSPPDL